MGNSNTATERGEWTYENDVEDQSGKVVVVTGGHNGFAFATAERLVEKGAAVIIGCRDERLGEAACDEILKKVPKGSCSFYHLDLSDLESIGAFARRFTSRHDRLDVLINAASLIGTHERQETKDGFELLFGTNYLGHFKLVAELISVLRETPGARIVNLSSKAAHMIWSLDFNDIDARISYSRFVRFAETKLAACLFTHALNDKLLERGWDIKAITADPGFTNANIQHDIVGDSGYFTEAVAVVQDKYNGSLPLLRAATDPALQGNEYIRPKNFFNTRGPPIIGNPPKASLNEEDQLRLWYLSIDMLGLPQLGLFKVQKSFVADILPDPTE